jgi:hypothetical protein
MSMLRLAERVMGEGDVFRAGDRVVRAGYELARYQQFTVDGSELIPRGEVVEGHLLAAPDLLPTLMGTAAPLTVHLDDGRRVDLYVVNEDGMVTSADERGFYDAPESLSPRGL